MKRSRNRNNSRVAVTVFAFAFALGLVVFAPIKFERTIGARTSLSNVTAPVEEAEGSSNALRAPTLQSMANFPLAFEANAGQAEPAVKFLARTGNSELLLTSRSITVQSRKSFGVQFVSANRATEPQGIDVLPGQRNYIVGNDPTKWRTGVPTFKKVIYEEIYRGIDLTFYGNQSEFEYDFVVKPGSDPHAIRLGIEGARPRISASGDLLLKRGEDELIQRKPIVYQDINGERRLVDGRYSIRRNREVSIEIGEYDSSRPLVIDPTLVYSTYIGGSGDDSGSSIAIDSNGNVYVAGTTASTNFPTHGPAFPSTAGLADIFVTKIDAAGANIVYSTYIGGSGLDRADGIAVDASGNAYVVGRVDSTSANFPTTAGSFGVAYRGGDFDGIVFKLNAQGNALVYSGFLGGEENDSTEGVAVDAAGIAYVTGGTKSNAFPTTGNAYQGQRAGDTDAFLTKINAAGSGFLYSTYVGGSGTDRGSGVVIDGTGVAYIAGYGASPDFPTEDPFQAGFGGGFDAFIAKFDTNASGINSFVFSTYLGGAGDDKAFGIAADSGVNNLYVTGQTSSNNFPVLNPAQASSGGSFDAFIAKVSNTGTKVYASYFGGSGDDRATGVAVNSTGVYLTGFSSSANLPTVSPLQLNNGGAFDAFVAKLNTSGTAFLYSTYLGGSANENFVAAVTSTNPIAVDTSNAYITGYTSSANFPLGSAIQGTNAGSQDAFVAKIADVTPAADFSLSITPASRTANPGNAVNYTVTATPVGGFTGSISLSVSGASNDTTSSFAPPSISITDASAKSSVLTISTTAASPPGTYSLNLTATSGNLQHGAAAQLIVSGPTSANLSLTKTASPNPGITLTNLTYRLIVSNNGPSPATSVMVTDNLPAGINFISATPTQGSCSGSTTVTCNLGSLARNASAIITVIVVPQTAGVLTNNANVTAAENDPDLTDNSASLQTTVNSPTSGPGMTDPNLSVKTVVSGLSQPTSMAFIGNNDFLIFEKNTGKVQRVINGVIQSTPAIDLAVNNGSERGGLGIALHPNFAFNGYVYLYWTESSTGVDSTNLADVALLGNRVDRYIWNGSTLTFDRNLIKLHAFQADANQSLRGNHNGGVLRFGPDGKLYILMGDNGRRGLLQNNQFGPVPDDQFGGPDPDNNHLTGFILRLNDDGSTPADNPFFNASTNLTGEAAANIKKLFAYGVRNGFGLGFDPYSGNLWDQENGDDAFDEMNRVTAGSNNGWIQMMGPNSRVAQYKQIESTYGSGDLQQLRWPTSLISDTPAGALANLYMLPGAHYNDPEFSWKYAIPPSPLGFVQGRGLGPQFEGDMFVGAARTFLANGFLFRFKFTPDRLHFSFSDPRLNDLVADNDDKFDIKESESLLIGHDFGITTDIETAPNGDLFVVSNSNGAVYEISGKQPTLFTASLTGAQETPATNSNGSGTATILLSPDETTARVSLNFGGLTSAQTDAHIHGPAGPGVVGVILFPLPNGNVSDFLISLTPTDVSNLKSGQLYVNVHTVNFPNGEIRGQFGTSASASSLQFSAANYLVSEAAGRATVTVTRLGDTSAAASVNYSTADNASNSCNVNNGNASSHCDYTTTIGTLKFAAGEAFKTIVVPITDDGYAEGNENFTISLSNASGASLGSPNVATVTITDNESVTGPNTIDAPDFFVHQHYIDFLGREPDASGYQFWINQITSCGADAQCTAVKRINVSAAFFLSIEFQQTGYYVYRTYKSAFGDINPPTVPVPVRLTDFFRDMQQVRNGVIVGQGNWQAQIDANKQAFALALVQRPDFIARYPALTSATAFVNSLDGNAGSVLTSTQRTALITELAPNSNDPALRADVLMKIAENQVLQQKEFNRAFVLMEYFGYLRRNPDDAPDANFAGYNFWLNKLNQFNGDFIGAEMVKAFISSGEYRQRFGP
jgi:uncharacterized repeat protein (TIGR01451 family)